MSKKQFKTESKKLLDLMINSIYTNKDIFLRELISNSSDALDKLLFISLTDKNIDVEKDELKIHVDIDKESRTITVTDNGIGMDKKELEDNLGTIGQSGSLLFKEENSDNKDIDIIGQFGVGFYSAFMVADKIEVVSRKYGEKEAYKWVSSGASGYEIKEEADAPWGTKITLFLKENTDEFSYDKYLEDYEIEGIIKKYSNYITYPIIMKKEESRLKEGSKDEYETVVEEETINSMIPLWKKNITKDTEEEFNGFYTDNFHDYEKPQKIFKNNIEGKINYTSLLFIPSHAPYDYYQKDYEKGLALYSNGVLIMDKCSDLLPDYFNFVKGLVDSPDVSLNISREILQKDAQISAIAKSVEGKIEKELKTMLEKDREEYIKFFKNFGTNLKFGIYNSFGMNKDKLQDLIMFYSSKEEKLITLKEYVDNKKDDQNKIYYATGESIDKIKMLPQLESFKEKDIDVLFFDDYIDEFTVSVLREYESLEFTNIANEDVSLSSEEDKKKIEKENTDAKDLLESMKEALSGKVTDVKFTDRLTNHPVCLTTKGNVSTNMEKIINAMPTDESVKSETVLEINVNHDIAKKLKDVFETNKDELKSYATILYEEARLIEGLGAEDPATLSKLVCELISK